MFLFTGSLGSISVSVSRVRLINSRLFHSALRCPYVFTRLMVAIATYLRKKGTCTVSIFGRLVGQKSGSSRNSERPTVDNQTDYVPRTDNQGRKVRFGSVSELCVHRNGIPNTQEHSSSAIRQSTGHSGTVTMVQETEAGLSKSLLCLFWEN